MEEWVQNQLRQHFRGEIKTDPLAREAASVDASIFKVIPAFVAIPKDVEDLKTLVRNVGQMRVTGQNVSLTARAGGTCMSGGSLTESVSVDMKPGFNWIGELNKAEKSIWVGAGTYYRDVEAYLTPKKLMFAPYTSSKDLCTIGGMVGNNASGEKSIRYGATIDNVLAVRMICADGNEYEFGSVDADAFAEKAALDTYEGYLYREIDKLIEENWDHLKLARPKVRKNAAGYQLWSVINKDQDDFNLAKLIVGSQGTLGIVTAVKLRLADKYRHRRMLIVPINNLSDLTKAVQAVLVHHPESLETYDFHTYELAKKYMPEMAELAKVSRDNQMVLMAQFVEHTKDQSDQYAEVCKEALERLGIKAHLVTKDNEAEAHWQIRRASYKLLSDHPYPGTRAVPCIEDTIVGVDHYAEFLSAWEAILSDYDMIYTNAGHIGDGSIRIIPLANMEAPRAADQIFELARRTYDLVFAFGGSMSADHNDGLIRTPFLSSMFSEDIMHVFAATKNLFDPQNMFNPGKKIGMTEAYAKAHMIRTNKG